MVSFAATIGADGLYLVFVWLLSAAAAAWIAERKGYGERVGLTFGLLLSAAGFLIVLLLPGRPGSKWRVEGWLPPRSSGRVVSAPAPVPAAAPTPAVAPEPAAAPTPEPPPSQESPPG